MADAPSMPSTIRCAACGFENTTTSLYCQDCGLRLVPPPSAIAAESTATAAPAKAATTPVRPARILSKNRAQAPRRSIFGLIFRVLIVAALAALLFLIFRPPADLPSSAVPLTGKIVGNVRAALEQCAQRGTPFDAPWSSLNSYLGAVLPSTPSAGPLHISFERALLAPTADGVSVFAERKIAGLRLVSRLDYRVVARSNGIGATPVAAALGSLPLPSWLSPAIEAFSGHLDQALAPELRVIRGARNVRISPEKASIDFGPSRP